MLTWARNRAVGPSGGRRVRHVKDPTVLGVHRAVGGALPPYVRRDAHGPVTDLLTPGRFVLLVGDACSGKSRLAWEAVSARLPGHRLFAPGPAGLEPALRDLAGAQRAVLWLDDLERFLGNETLSATVVDGLLAEGRRVVVATLRRHELEHLTAEPDRNLTDSRRRVLALADQVPVARAFTETELVRADDPSLVNVAELLAGGPQQLDRWQDGGHPHGAALVSAAVDCRRAGYLSPLPADLLDELAPHYLPEGVEPEPADRAWEWARTRWQDATALLETDGTGVTVFDYVVDHVQRTRPFEPVPDEVLRAALARAGPADAASMGYTAATAGRYEAALGMYRRALTGADILGRRNSIGVLLAHLGRLEEALAEHRLVLEARRHVLGPAHPDTLTSRNNLANVLNLLGHHESALAEHRTVLSVRGRLFGPDHPDTLASRDNVATVLNNLGRQDEALAEHRAEHRASVRVQGATHPDTLISQHNLAVVLFDMGRHREAAEELDQVLRARRRVLGPRHPDTLASRDLLISAMLENARYR